MRETPYPHRTETLGLVLPAFDEAAVIAQTLEEWIDILDQLEIDFEIHLYDDGSRDETPAIALEVAAREPRLQLHRQHNRGHGPTVLRGYRELVASPIDWIFQADGDAEIPPAEFARLWRDRADYDLLLGRRTGHASRLRRGVSRVARGVIGVFFGRGVCDVNSPFRLWRATELGPLLSQLPKSLYAPNVALCGLALRHHLRVLEIPVAYRQRRSALVGRKLFGGVLRAFKETLGVALSAAKTPEDSGA
ncbi:MAG: glycosyltransferase family 2 protein [Thermoanaerobaculia bacterium]|nr:glycosyltransferase family 2 protein [Thermoanaerobaculia bacterium]